MPPAAKSWPEADALFHRDPRWLGADAAYSVALGGDRVLWLFGDTFIATSEARVRREARMVRNSVAIQRGLDPARATIAFRWRETDGRPESFFPEEGGEFHWPLHGARLPDGTLALFLARVRDTPGVGLGFETVGWRLALVGAGEAELDPSAWRPRIVAPPAEPRGIVAGVSVLQEDGRVIALAIREPGDHAGFVVRWSPRDLAEGRLDRAEWSPAPVLADAGPECSVHRDPRSGKLLHVSSLGFGATSIGIRTADRLEGPWSEPVVVHRPPESSREGLLVYAGKAHPELDAGGDLAVTYASNSLDFGRLVADASIYFPRFVRIRR